MKSIQTSTLSNKEFSYNILNSIHVDVAVEKNAFDLPIDDVFLMAARINKKRSFLFVSKLLGKHLPINPSKGLLASALLASSYYEEVKGGQCGVKEFLLNSFLRNEPLFKGFSFIPKTFNPLIIGFAETATALGHAFFDCFEEAEYAHTTREILHNRNPVITFEEEHSHATSHRCYIPMEMIQNDREIILVDDELTTGKTALNIIRSIHSLFPRKEYSVVSILDWRSEANKQEFKNLEKELGITIHAVSLITGKVQVRSQKEIAEPKNIPLKYDKVQPKMEYLFLSSLFEEFHAPSILSNGRMNHAPFLKGTGRFGINSHSNLLNQKIINRVAAILEQKRTGKNSLFLGTGEFMYLPMRIAAEMGEGVSYQSTTRSPIFIRNEPQYGAGYGLAFPNPEDPGISHFVYNIPPGYYDEVFLFFEREVESEYLLPLLKELEKIQVDSIKLVYFTGKEGN